MPDMTPRLPHGKGCVRPLIYGPTALESMLDFLPGARCARRVIHATGGIHAEIEIDDSILVLELADPPYPGKTPGSVIVYVDDVDGTVRRAESRGFRLTRGPVTRPYGERVASVADQFGNTWWLCSV